jgi:hypothetical protein
MIKSPEGDPVQPIRPIKHRQLPRPSCMDFCSAPRGGGRADRTAASRSYEPKTIEKSTAEKTCNTVTLDDGLRTQSIT